MYDPSKPHNDLIHQQIKRTWKTKHLRVFGEYHYRKMYGYSWDVDHTDGIGTKGHFHWQCRTFHAAVLDALAMNINDLQMCKARPYKLQNHIMLPVDDKEAIREIITKMADECVSRHIAITGGECAFHDDLRGVEISMTMSGFLDKSADLEMLERDMPINNFKLGDVLIGLPSSGIHSNGFTLVRKLMQEHGSGKLPFRDSWLTPTSIYNIIDSCSWINGMQHITGGAFTKLKKRLSPRVRVPFVQMPAVQKICEDAGMNFGIGESVGTLDAVIHRSHNVNPQDDFQEIYKCTYSSDMMYRNFNCGIGMILSVNPNNVDRILKNVGGEVVGELKKGTGLVIIESKFDKTTLVL